MAFDVAARKKDLTAEKTEAVDVDFGAELVDRVDIEAIIAEHGAGFDDPIGVGRPGVADSGRGVADIELAAAIEAVESAKGGVVLTVEGGVGTEEGGVLVGELVVEAE